MVRPQWAGYRSLRLPSRGVDRQRGGVWAPEGTGSLAMEVERNREDGHFSPLRVHSGTRHFLEVPW